MADDPDGRKNWALLGTILTCIIGSFTLIQYAVAPMDERLIGLSGRVDGIAVAANQWRSEYAASVRQDIAEAIAQAEERRVRMADRQGELNADFGQAIGEVAGRFNRMMEERERLLGEAFVIRKQIQEHVLALDGRIRDLEETLERLPAVNCTPGGSCAAPFGPR